MRVCPASLAEMRSQFVVQRLDLLLHELPLTPQRVDQVARAWCKVGFGVLKNVSPGGFKLRWLLREHHASCESNARSWLITVLYHETNPLRTRWLAWRSNCLPTRSEQSARSCAQKLLRSRAHQRSRSC